MTDSSSASSLLAHQLDGGGVEPDRPGVILLNGGMMSHAAWQPIADRLVEHYAVLRCDFRGQLLSPTTAAQRLADHAADVEVLLDHVGWEAAHVIGVSFGGEVAVELMARSPQRVRSLVVVTAMDHEPAEFRRQSDQMREVLHAVADGGPRDTFYRLLTERVYSAAYRERHADLLAARREQIDRLPPAWFTGIAFILDALEDFDLRDCLSAHVPALAILAADDQVMAEERALALAEGLGAEIVVHASAGHGLVAEDPDFVAEHCVRWLARH
ncbi:MAG: alpha/beta hydrolase [Acidobacteriota bacterium]